MTRAKIHDEMTQAVKNIDAVFSNRIQNEYNDDAFFGGLLGLRAMMHGLYGLESPEVKEMDYYLDTRKKQLPLPKEVKN